VPALPPDTTADADVDARQAIWASICAAADDVRHRLDIKSICELNGRDVRAGTPVPLVQTWLLIEALSLLCLFVRCEDAAAHTVNVFGKMGPVEIREDGLARHVWAQQTLKGDASSLNSRPDIVVTTTPDQPHPGNAVRIIDAKCVKELGTPAIRAEFGKAYDLRVTTYFIWSFYSPTERVVQGARGLGIDVQALGFDTDRRQDLLRSPEALISHVAHSQEQARRGRRFGFALEAAGENASRKLLGPGQQ
jgi:hypothetical protein